MIRRLLLGVLLASLGTAAFALLAAASDPRQPTSGEARLTDLRTTVSIVDAPSGAVDAVLGERVERGGEVARSEARQSARHQRTVLWGVTAVIAALIITALSMTIARRRTGRTAIRAGRVAPARAPPLSFACS